MGILKNQQIGRHDNVTVLRFGTGDIEISNGHDRDNPEIKVLAFGQHTQKPKEEWNVDIPVEGSNTDSFEDLVLLKFTQPESIDNIIKHLRRVKKDLNKLSKISGKK